MTTNEGELYVLGGTTGGNNAVRSDQMLKLQCQGDVGRHTCQWIKLDQTLKNVRSHGSAIALEP